MDPLSLCASVAGLISLALDVTTILNGYIGSVKSAPQEASDLNIEVAALSKVLPKLNDALRTDDISESTSDNQSILCAIVDACKGHLTSVLEHIAKLRSTSKVSEVVGRMTWPLKRNECLQSVHTVHRYVQTLQVLLVNSNRNLLLQTSSAVIEKLEEQHKRTMASIEMMQENLIDVPEGMIRMSEKLATVVELVSDLKRHREEMRKISEGVEKLRVVAEDDVLEKILNWISPLEPRKRHQDISSQRLNDTRTWFLKKEEYLTWFNGDNVEEKRFNPVLAFYGIPGAGKSVMSSLVVDTLLAASCPLAYVYCDYRDDEKQTAINMLGSLLKQILSMHLNQISNELLDSLHERRKKGSLDLETGMQSLKSALKRFTKFYICVDALDECKDDERRLFLRSLSQIVDSPESSVQIFVTGRSNMQPVVEKNFPVLPCAVKHQEICSTPTGNGRQSRFDGGFFQTGDCE